MTKDFIKAALIRALHTAAQTAVATIGTTAMIQEVNWLAVLSCLEMRNVSVPNLYIMKNKCSTVNTLKRFF